MNFLALCQRVRQETGIAGTGPSSVLNQTGELRRLVDWVASAYNYVCAKNVNWEFLRSSFSVNTVAGTEAYAPTSCTDSVLSAAIGSATVGDMAVWMPYTFRIYLQSAGASTRRFFWQIHYSYFRDIYELIVPPNAMPAYFAIRPRDQAILCGPKPDAVYVIEGDYYRAAPALVNDTDTPLFPARFHELLVQMAKIKYAGYEGDGGVYAESAAEWNRLIAPLEKDQLPLLETGAPLA